MKKGLKLHKTKTKEQKEDTLKTMAQQQGEERWSMWGAQRLGEEAGQMTRQHWCGY